MWVQFQRLVILSFHNNIWLNSPVQLEHVVLYMENRLENYFQYLKQEHINIYIYIDYNTTRTKD